MWTHESFTMWSAPAPHLPRWATSWAIKLDTVLTWREDGDAYVEARFDGGELSIVIPRRAHARRRVVPIRVNGVLPAPRAALARPRSGYDALVGKVGGALRRWLAAARAWFG